MSRWRARVNGRVHTQIAAAPEPVQLEAYRWIFKRLPLDPFVEPHVDPIRSAQRKIRKGGHVHLGGKWRLIYVVLPLIREVFVYDCVEHQDDYLYSKKYIDKMLRASRRNPEALERRIADALQQNAEWGAVRLARIAGCSPAAITKYRVAHGVAARNSMPWLKK